MKGDRITIILHSFKDIGTYKLYNVLTQQNSSTKKSGKLLDMSDMFADKLILFKKKSSC